MRNPGRSLRDHAVRLKKAWGERSALSVFLTACREIFGLRKSSRSQMPATCAAWWRASDWLATALTHFVCHALAWAANPTRLNFPSFSTASLTISGSLDRSCADAVLDLKERPSRPTLNRSHPERSFCFAKRDRNEVEGPLHRHRSNESVQLEYQQ